VIPDRGLSGAFPRRDPCRGAVARLSRDERKEVSQKQTRAIRLRQNPLAEALRAAEYYSRASASPAPSLPLSPPPPGKRSRRGAD